jgi:hypothetical protein
MEFPDRLPGTRPVYKLGFAQILLNTANEYFDSIYVRSKFL